MTDQQPPDWVQAWQVALGCEVFGPPGLWMYRPVQPGPVRLIPNRDSGDFFKAMVLAAKHVRFRQFDDGSHGVSWWNSEDNVGNGTGPDQVSALIAAVLASKGGGK